MKKTLKGFLFTVLFALHLTLSGQTTPEALLGQLPAVPNVDCAADVSVIDRFNNRIDNVLIALKQAADRIQAEAKNNEANTKEEALSDVARETGLSRNDLERLQRENAGEEQALKMAEKSLGGQFNLSLEEVQKLSEMSEADQEKWAQNYAGRQMQKAQQNPQAVAKKQAKSARLFELAKEQKVVNERITARMERIANLFTAVDLQDSIETRKMNEKLPALERQLCSGICSPAEIARSKAAERQIYNLRLQYCEKMSPMLTDAISKYLTTVKALFPDHRRLIEIQNEMATLQSGVIISVNTSCYKAVNSYASALSSAYRFWAGKFEQ